MYDLQVLADRAEITRISTMMYARDTSGATFPASGVRDGFHGAAHHSNIRSRMDSFALINRYHVQMGHTSWRSCAPLPTAKAIGSITPSCSTAAA